MEQVLPVASEDSAASAAAEQLSAVTTRASVASDHLVGCQANHSGVFFLRNMNSSPQIYLLARFPIYSCTFWMMTGYGRYWSLAHFLCRILTWFSFSNGENLERKCCRCLWS